MDMLKEEMLMMLTNDLVENYPLFKSLKDDVSKLVERFDGRGIDWTYDEFCIKFIDNLKRKNIKSSITIEQMKKFFFDSMVELSVKELEIRGREESKMLNRILMNEEYE